MSGCWFISAGLTASLKTSRCGYKKVNCTYGWPCVEQLSKLISNPLVNCLFVTYFSVKYEKPFLQTPHGNFSHKLVWLAVFFNRLSSLKAWLFKFLNLKKKK